MTERETEGPRSIHVITFPLNSCQGPSAAISLMKCSWCYEQSARRITSWITTQKPRMLKAQRLCFHHYPHVSKQPSTLCFHVFRAMTLDISHADSGRVY